MEHLKLCVLTYVNIFLRTFKIPLNNTNNINLLIFVAMLPVFLAAEWCLKGFVSETCAAVAIQQESPPPASTTAAGQWLPLGGVRYSVYLTPRYSLLYMTNRSLNL